MHKKLLNNIQHVCFDLDGTLVDSYLTIYKTTVKTLEVLNIPGSFSKDDLSKRIGHHFDDIFRELNIPVPDVDYFIKVFRTYYFDFIDDSILYPGVADVLDYLKNEGISVSLLTTKGQEQADRIIDHFNLRHNFSLVMGIREGIQIKPLPGGLLMICKELNILPAHSMMVGDTELDIRCGINAGVKTCGVTYGYRTRELLQAEHPDFIIDKITELIE
jgi:phosphoglycolate phosphatase-like HAD superfamily hydrolase